MLSAAYQSSTRQVSTGLARSTQATPALLCPYSQFATKKYVAPRQQKQLGRPSGTSASDIAEKAARKILKRLSMAPRDGLVKETKRDLDRKQMRREVIGHIPPHPKTESPTDNKFNPREFRPEDLEAPGYDEGGIALEPELRIEVGSFVEVRRNGDAQWGIALGYQLTPDGVEVLKTLLGTGELIKHSVRDVQFSVPGFAPTELALRAGENKYANEKRYTETQARIGLGKLLRSLNARVERTQRQVGRASQRLYDNARHPDGTTWSKITLDEGVALVAEGDFPTLDLVFAVHQHFMDNPLRYIADTFDHRLSKTFSVRPAADVERIERVVEWVRNNNPVIEEFTAKARAIVAANKAQRLKTSDANPAWVSGNGLPEFNDTDQDILEFFRSYLRQRRELQNNPCALALPVILNQISPSYLPLNRHNVFEVLEDLGLLAPWSNHVMQDVDLQLQEFTDTLATPLPKDDAPPTPPVMVNDDRISREKTIDGLDNMRHDFGDLPVYVIDDVTAQELDDGISVERTTDGSDNVWIHVHIADPTSVIGPNDPLAIEACRRAATAYFPDATFPMLPVAELSLDAVVGKDGEASMNVLTFSALVSPAGELVKHQIRPGIVRRVQVMRYDDVTLGLGESLVESIWPFGKTRLEEPVRNQVPREALSDLELLRQVTDRLAQARVAKTDSVFWSQPRAVVSMEKVRLLSQPDPRRLPRMYAGYPKIGYSVQLGTLDHLLHGMDTARFLVAECAVTAGRVASLFAQEHGIPIVYRSLERPYGIGVDKYLSLLKKRHPIQGSVLYRDALAQNLVPVSVKPMLSPATHWQLGLSAEEGYVRATSPLRRYLDMLCHWQIKSALHPKSSGVKPPFTLPALKSMMMKQHLQEQARRRAGTTSERLWALRYIRDLLARGGHPTLRSLTGIVAGPPINMAHSLEQVIPVMIPDLGLPASVEGCDVARPPPLGSSIPVEIKRIELGYNPRLVMKLR